MSTFVRATAALGGRLSDLEGTAIAMKLLDRDPVYIKTAESFNGDERQPALRAQVIDIEANVVLGTFLVFWAGVKTALLDADVTSDFVVGTLVKEPHPTNEGHDLWVLGDAPQVTDEQIMAAIG